MRMSFLKTAGVNVIALLYIVMSFGFADASEIDLKITSLTNTRGNGAMEACGTARHSDGMKPLIITILHGGSSYSTLTSDTDHWCALIKRWTGSGKIRVYAVTLLGDQKSEELLKEVPQRTNNGLKGEYLLENFY